MKTKTFSSKPRHRTNTSSSRSSSRGINHSNATNTAATIMKKTTSDNETKSDEKDGSMNHFNNFHKSEIPTTSKEKHWSKDSFNIGYEIGKGAFGTVVLCQEKISKFICCMKILRKKKLRNQGDQIIREINIHRTIKHPNIIQLYQWFHDEENICLILEYATNGELKKYLEQQLVSYGRGFDEETTIKYIYQIASALKILKDNNIIHRDIKPENILVGSNGQLKLCDFGWSKQTKELTYTVCGTPDYLCPEILQEDARSRTHTSPHGHAVDLWCLGVLTFELIVGDAPFSFENEDHYNTWPKQKQKHWFKKLTRRIMRVDIQYPFYVSSGARCFINSLLQKDPIKRANIEDLAKSKWMSSNLKELGVKEIYNLPYM